MKNKVLLAAAAFIMTLSCSTTSYIHVPVILPQSETLSFEDYASVYFTGFDITPEWDQYDPRPEIKTFFLDDFAKAIGKTITPLDRPISYYEEKEKLLQEFNQIENALLITGKISTQISKRSVIQEQKIEGETQKHFVSIEHWDMTMEIILYDSKKAEVITKNEFKEKLSNADPKSLKFNFESLFFKNMDKFIGMSQTQKRFQKRYLLIK